MMPNAVCWFEIYVDEMKRAKAFYESVLALELSQIDTSGMPNAGSDAPTPEMWSFPMSEGFGAPGALCKMPGVPAGGNSTLIYFACEDCSIEAARVASAGGQLMVPKMSIGEHGFIAIARDTEGNHIGLHSER